MKKVLVLGGGFAGIESAIYLRKNNFDVTLVSDRDFFYIYPTSIWVPTGETKFKDICVELIKLQDAHGFKIIIDPVRSIEAKEHRVTLKSGRVMDDYDYLVIAIGASKMKAKGIEHTLSICGAPEQSLLIKDRVQELVEKGSGKIAFGFGGNPNDTSAVRGGPGFELLFNVHNLLKKKGIRENYELTFFAPMPKPGARMGEKALKMMDMFFERTMVKKHFGKKIKAFQNDGVIFEDDSKLESDFTMFIPAGDGHEIIKDSDLPKNAAGFVKIDDFCRVEGFEYIYAVGDVAAIEGPEWRAKQGHIAEVMARNAAHNINEQENNADNHKGYQEHLNILCVMDSGDGAAFVYRDEKKAKMIPLPILGHWLKKGWGKYCRLSKLGRIPRIPGL
ncbi:FAD-dependent oxidoreductase [Sulfurimonas sp. HSL-1716]|uniref:NAD(P)/FAD-dependent oxidoreductase n=1 Tax=Hydrocurvibacter sulfurireducens TaxID=3131937 RepID=UPI0031F98743